MSMIKLHNFVIFYYLFWTQNFQSCVLHLHLSEHYSSLFTNIQMKIISHKSQQSLHLTGFIGSYCHHKMQKSSSPSLTTAKYIQLNCTTSNFPLVNFHELESVTEHKFLSCSQSGIISRCLLFHYRVKYI